MTVLPASVTFTRASIGTYFDSNGVLQTALAGAARFDHDPVTLAPLGLLIEQARTNLQRYSQDFSQWPATQCTKAPAAALDGTTSATEIIANNTVNAHKLDSQTITVDTTSTYTVSFYAKKGAANFVSLSMAGAYNYCAWNLDTGTLAGNGTPWTNPGIQACGNGWYRCYANGIFIGTTATPQIYAALTVASAGQPNTAAGDGVAPWITIWGAQIELGAFSTSYVPTTTATVPRSADAVKMTGVNFSSWYNQLAGTIAASRIDREATQNEVVAAVNDNTTANRLVTYRNNLKAASGLVTVAGTAYNVPGTTAPSGNVNLTAMTFTAGRAALCQNGGTVTSSAPPTMPVVTQLEIGSAIGGSYMNGTLAFLRYWNVAKTDAELQEITNPVRY
jgi:hypothetical protein